MQIEQEQAIVAEAKRYITDHLQLSELSDDELEEKTEEIVRQRIGNEYCPIDQVVSIVRQVFSSIRGFGLLDSIIYDDSVTEVTINGPDRVFIEKDGKLAKLDRKFESQRRV
jgi:pilus assembly protein CpaF